jgi:hypothetical protein
MGPHESLSEDFSTNYQCSIGFQLDLKLYSQMLFSQADCFLAGLFWQGLSVSPSQNNHWRTTGSQWRTTGSQGIHGELRINHYALQPSWSSGTQTVGWFRCWTCGSIWQCLTSIPDAWDWHGWGSLTFLIIAPMKSMTSTKLPHFEGSHSLLDQKSSLNRCNSQSKKYHDL